MHKNFWAETGPRESRQPFSRSPLSRACDNTHNTSGQGSSTIIVTQRNLGFISTFIDTLEQPRLDKFYCTVVPSSDFHTVRTSLEIISDEPNRE